MKKVLYIIPGWEETHRRKPYKTLETFAMKKGYEVVFIDVNWKKPLSSQVIPVTKNAVVFGFSLGAILAWLIVQKYPCQHLILASMTPHYSFSDKKIKKALISLAGSRFVGDIVRHLRTTHKAKKQTILYGDLEEEKGDILVHNTGHELNNAYLRVIAKLL